MRSLLLLGAIFCLFQARATGLSPLVITLKRKEGNGNLDVKVAPDSGPFPDYSHVRCVWNQEATVTSEDVWDNPRQLPTIESKFTPLDGRFRNSWEVEIHVGYPGEYYVHCAWKAIKAESQVVDFGPHTFLQGIDVSTRSLAGRIEVNVTRHINIPKPYQVRCNDMLVPAGTPVDVEKLNPKWLYFSLDWQKTEKVVEFLPEPWTLQITALQKTGPNQRYILYCALSEGRRQWEAIQMSTLVEVKTDLEVLDPPRLVVVDEGEEGDARLDLLVTREDGDILWPVERFHEKAADVIRCIARPADQAVPSLLEFWGYSGPYKASEEIDRKAKKAYRLRIEGLPSGTWQAYCAWSDNGSTAEDLAAYSQPVWPAEERSVIGPAAALLTVKQLASGMQVAVQRRDAGPFTDDEQTVGCIVLSSEDSPITEASVFWQWPRDQQYEDGGAPGQLYVQHTQKGSKSVLLQFRGLRANWKYEAYCRFSATSDTSSEALLEHSRGHGSRGEFTPVYTPGVSVAGAEDNGLVATVTRHDLRPFPKGDSVVGCVAFLGRVSKEVTAQDLWGAPTAQSPNGYLVMHAVTEKGTQENITFTGLTGGRDWVVACALSAGNPQFVSTLVSWSWVPKVEAAPPILPKVRTTVRSLGSSRMSVVAEGPRFAQSACVIGPLADLPTEEEAFWDFDEAAHPDLTRIAAELPTPPHEFAVPPATERCAVCGIEVEGMRSLLEVQCATTGCSPGSGGEVGSHTCTECPEGTVAPTETTSVQPCAVCTQHATSPSGATECLCVAGYEPSAGACVACQPGTYKQAVGNELCSECPAHATSAAGALACLCQPGYARPLPGDECTACPAGSYKEATSDEHCVACPANSDSGPAASSCLCTPGYERAQGACTACAAGTYKEGLSDEACAACPSGSSSPAAATVCECVPGYERLGAHGPCSACEAGSFKNTTGDSTCALCPVNSIAPAPGRAEPCLSCPARTYSGFTTDNGTVLHRTACYCNATGDFYPLGDLSEPCLDPSDKKLVSGTSRCSVPVLLLAALCSIAYSLMRN